MTKARVVVGISGGVDSSVSALRLLQQGYDVHGVFMKNWEDSYEPGYCAAAQDLEDAEDSCDTLGIPLHKVNFSNEYRERVFRYFLDEYRRGRTPNPDVLCNKEIKFKAFLRYAQRLGADRIATGHYARAHLANGRWSLLKGADRTKDQSYFLHSLDQGQLGKALFPVGALHKTQVRELAKEAGLVTHDKKDSTGICFIGERDFRAFLGRYLPARPGEMRTVDGQIIGEHAGLSFYTLGQRQGLGIGGQRGGGGGAWYVVDKDIANNVLVVAEGSQHPRLYHRRLLASQLEWVAGRPPPSAHRCGAKIRYRQAEQACTIESLSGRRCTVAFQAAQRAITPGQSVVFYAGEECLGGGIIDAAFD